MTASAPRSQPLPVVNGSNWSARASLKGLRGKTCAIRSAQLGMSPYPITPETQDRTTAVAMDAAWATAAERASPATATPAEAKQVTATSTVTTVAGIVCHWTCTS